MKAFKVLMNVLSFGIPLLVSGLLKIKSFDKLLNDQANVVVIINEDGHSRSEVLITVGRLEFKLHSDLNIVQNSRIEREE